jgi:broad specificity phosphatase PhoE
MNRSTLLCIRHAESTFNAAWAATGSDPLHFDARLTARGREQVRQARESFLRYRIEVVLVSPLTRALETAVGLFAGHPSAPPIEVLALLRERAESSCDVGRPPADLAADFPALAFAHLPPVWWHTEGAADERGVHVESDAVVQARVGEFRRSLVERRERVIAVVGHGTFLRHLTGRTLANCEVAQVDLA